MPISKGPSTAATHSRIYKPNHSTNTHKLSKRFNLCIDMCVYVLVHVYMSRPVYVYEYECSVMSIPTCTCLFKLYDYVQCCEGTVGVELRYINQIYYYHYFYFQTSPVPSTVASSL